MYPPIFERAARVAVRGGPYEAPCPNCGKPVADRAPSITGTVFSGPSRPVFHCRRRARVVQGIATTPGCGHRWQADDGWYLIDADNGATQLAPWTAIERLTEVSS